MSSAVTAPTERQQLFGRVASVLVGLEALVVAAFAVYYVVELVQGLGSDPMVVIMSVVTLAVFAVGLAYVAAGLRRRHPRAQAPAIAFNFLMVPLGIAMFSFAPPLLAAAVLVAAVATIACAVGMGQLTAR